MNVTPYQFPEKEVHMVGDYVGVVWNTVQQKKTMKDASGLVYTAYAPLRHGEPYIDFVSIRHSRDNDEVREDEDSPVDGGLGLEKSIRLSEELTLAIEYLSTIITKRENS